MTPADLLLYPAIGWLFHTPVPALQAVPRLGTVGHTGCDLRGCLNGNCPVGVCRFSRGVRRSWSTRSGLSFLRGSLARWLLSHFLIARVMSIVLGLRVPALSQRGCFGSLSSIAAGYDWVFRGPLDGLKLSVHVPKGHGRVARLLLGGFLPLGLVGPGLRSGLRKGASE